MNPWISVKDRLPISGSFVLIQLNYKDRDMVVAQFLGNLVTLKKDYINLFIVHMPNKIRLSTEDHQQFYLEKRQVTHWMPLPEPPHVG